MDNKVKNWNQFITENVDKSQLDIWNDLLDKYDLIYYKQFMEMSKSDLEQIQEEYNVIRINALNKLNKENNVNKLNIDVSDEELYKYVDIKYKTIFLKYSRIIFFNNGNKPDGFVLIK